MTRKANSLPHWPARMQIHMAAAYLGISGSKLDRGWRAGDYPAPREDGKNCLWLKSELDDYIDRWAHSGSVKLDRWP